MPRIAVLLALVAAGCGSDPAAGSDRGGGGTVDVGGDVAVDVDDRADVDDLDAAADLGTFDTADADDDVDDTDAAGLLDVGELCEDNAECASEMCVTIDIDSGAGVCSQPCTDDAGCPDGAECAVVDVGGGDPVRVCLPRDLCVDLDGDGYGVGPGCAGDDCDDDADNVYVNADEACDGVDNDCDGRVDDNPVGVGGACTSAQLGPCAPGTLVCDGGLAICVPSVLPVAERCNGVDDDCNGFVDDGGAGDEPMSRACYSAPPETEGVGVCTAGAEICTDGEWSTCIGAVVPGAEVCNGADDDCDGVVDDGDPEGGGPCVTGLPGACAPGVFACLDTGRTCVPSTAPRAEVCNGIDDDCDGAVDEDDAGALLARSCYTGPAGTAGVGVCGGGTQTCVDGDWATCDGEVVPSAEECNGRNDDCDADGVDEGNPGGGLACSTGEAGRCGAGTTLCSDGGTVCVATLGPIAETCNGIDDDCDGDVDEDDAGGTLARSCYSGAAGTLDVGVCLGGTQTCADGAWSACGGEVTPSAEECNGRNDDCDADGADEGNPGGGLVCTSDRPGRCELGTTVCADGGVQCVSNQGPVAETCNGQDDDCDGDADEGDDGLALARACYSGAPGTQDVGACRAGVETCASAAWAACVGQVTPIPETCNGIDDNCNSASDEGCPSSLSLSGASNSARFGGGGGGDFNTQCPSGQLLVGMNVRAGSKVDRVQAVCGTATLIEQRGTTPYTYTVTRGSGATLAVAGGGGGTAYTMNCPTNQFAVGIVGRGGAELDQIALVCATLRVTGTPGSYVVSTSDAVTLTARGGSGGSAFSHTCAGTGTSAGVIRGIFGRSGARVDGLGVTCGVSSAVLR